MEYKGIIITGTSGSGKTTIAQKLCAKLNEFEIVTAVTTRTARAGEVEPNYSFIDLDAFQNLINKNDLIIQTKYRNEYYGILFTSYQKVIDKQKIPILIVSPESSNNIIKHNNEVQHFLSFFIDADDSDLTFRLSERDLDIAQCEISSRNFDRTFKHHSLFYILNNSSSDLGEIINLIFKLWNLRNSSGIIPYQVLEKLIKYSRLIEPYNNVNISAASYDLTLGSEYFQNGKIKELTDRNPSVLINPGDFVIAESKENVNLPCCISARFDLTVSMFCKGLILSNGPQVDPGYSGKLFCLLFNTSNNIVELKKDNHYASIEFSKLIEPTEKPYVGKYQDKEKIFLFLPELAKHSVTSDLKKQISALQKEIILLKYLPIIISIAALTIAILKLIQK